MIELTFDAINKAMREVAAEQPDFVYVTFRNNQLTMAGISASAFPSSTNCVYFDEDNEPSCIFGKALHKLGISQENIHEDVSIDHLLSDMFGLSFEREQLNFLASVQENQDNDTRKMTWPEAIADADEAYDGKFNV